jgi:two-component system, NtrC family, response regulator AtoC
MEKILLVEDDETLNTILTEELLDNNFEVKSVKTLKDASSILKAQVFDLVISDLKLPDGNGEKLIRSYFGRPLAPSFIMITAFGTIKQAVECLKIGASDFLTKPLDFEHLIISIHKVLETRRLQALVQLQQGQSKNGYLGLIGRSPKMIQIYNEIEIIGSTTSPALIMGESGTGKELIARALHKSSESCDGPFVPVNCAGIPEELFESEFFGHLEGAFTGASKKRRGLFQEAEGGTLFLDEISEMPLNLQSKLLRVIQDLQIKKVGSDTYEESKVRIIAATNRDLEIEVKEKRFRDDLYFRLEAFSIYVPPLRDRDGDVEILLDHFIKHYSILRNKTLNKITQEAMDALNRYDYPGNIRELINIIDRVVTFSNTSTLEFEHLPQKIKDYQPPHLVGKSDETKQFIVDEEKIITIEDLDRRYVAFVLNQFNGNKRRAAMALGIGRKTLYRKYFASNNEE